MKPGHWSYDDIADIYATDMGKNMPFDDVAWYVDLAKNLGGGVLELGCGTGRILLPLMKAGVFAIGVDRSRPMLLKLQQDALSLGLQPVLAQTDICHLGLTGAFRCILLPYALITYVPDRESVLALLRDLSRNLERNGRLVVDSFVPKPMKQYAEFKLDYKRDYEGGMLERSKRVTLLSDHRHLIERRYLVRDAQGMTLKTIDTSEVTRPYYVEDLTEIVRAAGLEVNRLVFDYQFSDFTSESRFFTLILRRA